MSKLWYLIDDMAESSRQDKAKRLEELANMVHQIQATIDNTKVEAGLKETAYLINEMLNTKPRISEEEPILETAGPSEDLDPLITDDPTKTSPDLIAEMAETCPITSTEDHVINDDAVQGELEAKQEQEIDQQAGVINELKEQVSQISSAFYERREEELNEDSTSVQDADASTIYARTDEELSINQETSAEDKQETSAGSTNSGKEIPISNTPLPFPMQVIAPKDHTIDKDELGGRLEARNEQNNPTMERPAATSQVAPPKMCEDPGTLTITRDVDSYILQMGDASDNGPLARILGQSILLAKRTKNEIGTRLLSLTLANKTPNFHIREDSDRPYMRKRPRLGTFEWKPGWRGTRGPPDETTDATRPAARKDVKANPPDRWTNTRARLDGPVAMSKKSSPTRKDVKANPPDRWRGDTRIPLHVNFGQTEEVAEAKFDLTRPWDPNL